MDAEDAANVGTAALSGSGIGALAAPVVSMFGANYRNKKAEAAAARQMELQIHSAKRAHRWEVRDLKKAGLNPILSANKGASPIPGAMPHFEDIATPAVNSAMQAMRLIKDLEHIDADINLKKSQAVTQSSQAALMTQALPTATAMGELGGAIVELISNVKGLTPDQTKPVTSALDAARSFTTDVMEGTANRIELLNNSAKNVSKDVGVTTKNWYDKGKDWLKDKWEAIRKDHADWKSKQRGN